MKARRAAVLAIAALVAAFVGSVDLRYGDLRYSIDNLTMRHWSVVTDNILFNKGCAAGFLPSGGYPCGGGGGNYTLTGPSSANFDQASSNFTVTGTPNTVVITPSDSKHGIFTPSTVDLSLLGTTFTYTPLETGTNSVATTNSDSQSDPSAVSVTVANNMPGYANFGNGWAVNAGGGSLTTSGEPDPWGGTTGALFTQGTATNSYQNVVTGTINAVPTITVAVFIKQSVAGTNGTPSVELNINDPTFTAGGDVIVTPSTCTVAGSASWGGAVINSSSATKPTGAGTGWCLAQMNIALGASYTTSVAQIFMTEGTTDLLPAGDGTSAVDLYGPVME